VNKFCCLCFFFILSCVSGTQKSLPSLSLMRPETSAKKLLQYALEYGGSYHKKLKLICRNAPQKSKQVAHLIHQTFLGYSLEKKLPKYALPMANLYLDFLPANAWKVFDHLVNAEDKTLRRIAWIIARRQQTLVMKERMDWHLTSLIEKDRLERAFLPEMALAISSHSLRSAYTIINQALIAQGDPVYAKTMTRLNKDRASYDFLNYLALVTPEELRQVTVRSVNLLTCQMILDFYVYFPPPLSHPNLDYLFYYAISRSDALINRSLAVINRFLPKYGSFLALKLSRTSVATQTAYINNANRRVLTRQQRMLMVALKEITISPLVLADLEDVLVTGGR